MHDEGGDAEQHAFVGDGDGRGHEERKANSDHTNASFPEHDRGHADNRIDAAAGGGRPECISLEDYLAQHFGPGAQRFIVTRR